MFCQGQSRVDVKAEQGGALPGGVGPVIEIADKRDVAHYNQRVVPGKYSGFRRIENIAVPQRIFEGDYSHTFFIQHAGLLECLSGKRRIIRNDDILNTYGPVPGPEHYIQETDDRGPYHLGNHPHAADGIRHYYAVGAGHPVSSVPTLPRQPLILP